MTKKQKNFYHLNFGGFYESIHNYKLDNYLNALFQNETSRALIDQYAVDWKQTKIKYCKDWLLAFNNWLECEFKIDFGLKFSELWRPSYYNYTTDSIILQNSKLKINKILKFYNKNKNYFESLELKDEFYLKENVELILEFLALKFNESSEFDDLNSFEFVLINKNIIINDLLKDNDFIKLQEKNKLEFYKVFFEVVNFTENQ